MKLKPRIMYIEHKRDGISSPARIGFLTFSKSGKSIYSGVGDSTRLLARASRLTILTARQASRIGSPAARNGAAIASIPGPSKSMPMPVSNIGKRFATFLKTRISRSSSAMGSTPNRFGHSVLHWSNEHEPAK